MPQITVWCLPPKLGEHKLRQLHKSIVAAAMSVKELGLRGESDMLTVFPPDMMKYGAGTEIMVQVSELWDKPERSSEVRNYFAKALGETVSKMFPKAVVAVRLDPPFNPYEHGFWTSRKETMDALTDKESPLYMPVGDFFTTARLLSAGASSPTAYRARQAMCSIATDNDLRSMKEFLAHYNNPNRYGGRFGIIPNCGDKSKQAVLSALEATGLRFEN